ncbi:MAG: hypothetical protein FWF69_08735 [Firmicutes bacterium]|nr:hypothetical protein [Bacillota bacterium]
MYDTRITKERIRNHFTYSLWKYALLAVFAIFGWNLIYSSTAYRAPKDKRLDVYFVTYSLPDETTKWIREQILAMYPQLEDAACVSIVYTGEDNYYGSVQISTYIGAGEGDVYLLTAERFDALKGEGVFLNLDGAIDSGEIDLRGIDAGRCAVAVEGGGRGICGIPAESLYGLMDRGVDNRDLVICVMAYSGNQGTAVRFVDWLIEAMHAPKPEWVAELEAKQSADTQGISQIPSY